MNQGVFYRVRLRDLTERNHIQPAIARLAAFPGVNPTPGIEINMPMIDWHKDCKLYYPYE